MVGDSRDFLYVLSIGRLSGPDSERYYLDKVARGREDYYSGRGEMPGEWAGGGVDLLMESDGEVTDQQFSAVLAGRSPVTGEPLGRTSHRSVHGFDLTFRAPKSVSLLYGIGDAGVSSAAREAHDVAVREALGYLEREACWTRRGKGGAEHLRGDGFVATAFRHRTSRAGDPMLHTHVVVANVTHADGRWSSLDARHLYRHAKTAGYLYQAALRAQLTESLGVSWEVVHHGTADVVGVPRRVIEHFSTRRAQILEYMAERGEHSARAAQIATLQTRAPKVASEPFDRLRADWRARATEHGFGPTELADLIARYEVLPMDRLEEARLVVDQALPELTEQSSSFDRRDVLRAWAERHRQGAPVATIEAMGERWLATTQATALEPEVPTHKLRRFSTPEMLETERQLVHGANERKRCGAGRAPRSLIDDVLARRGELGDEQARMVRRLTMSGDGVQVVRAAAGSGKTYALDAAREIWQRADHTVLGCSLSARAAVELQDQTAIPSTTLARLQHDLRRGHPLPHGAVLVIDEAGMVGTRALAELAQHAGAADAKLVVCGDDRQLPEIEAGGGLRGLAKQLGAIELREVRRQRHEWDRRALHALRQGRLEEWADAYREHDRIVAGSDATTVRARLVDDWHQARQQHPDEDHIMLAHRRADVAELNQRARERLHASGQLGDTEITIGERSFSEGDLVVTTRNHRANEIVNGERGRITSVDTETAAVTVQFQSGRQVTLPSGYVSDGHLDHGYAMTAHRAQGATVDRAFVLGSDDLYREWGYTALSRHREEARFYVNLGHDAQLQLPGLDITRERPADPLTGPLSQRHAKHLALDVAHAQQPDPTLAVDREPRIDVPIAAPAAQPPGSHRDELRADPTRAQPAIPEAPEPRSGHIPARAAESPQVDEGTPSPDNDLREHKHFETPPDHEAAHRNPPEADPQPVAPDAADDLPPAEAPAGPELLPELDDTNHAPIRDKDPSNELLPNVDDGLAAGQSADTEIGALPPAHDVRDIRDLLPHLASDDAEVPAADLDDAESLLPDLDPLCGNVPQPDQAIEALLPNLDLPGGDPLTDPPPGLEPPVVPDVDLGPDLDIGP